MHWNRLDETVPTIDNNKKIGLIRRIALFNILKYLYILMAFLRSVKSFLLSQQTVKTGAIFLLQPTYTVSVSKPINNGWPYNGILEIYDISQLSLNILCKLVQLYYCNLPIPFLSPSPYTMAGRIMAYLRSVRSRSCLSTSNLWLAMLVHGSVFVSSLAGFWNQSWYHEYY